MINNKTTPFGSWDVSVRASSKDVILDMELLPLPSTEKGVGWGVSLPPYKYWRLDGCDAGRECMYAHNPDESDRACVAER